MKTFKRIMAIILLIVTVLAVSYLVYTAKQIQPETAVSEVLYEVAKTTLYLFYGYAYGIVYIAWNICVSAIVLQSN